MGLVKSKTFKGKMIVGERQFVFYFPDDRKHWGRRANAAIFDQNSGMKYILFFDDEPEM
jgi:hypothetical protein